MGEYLEVWGRDGPRLVALEGAVMTLGRSSGSALTLEDDQASRLHAVIERLGPDWCIRDLASRNGTFVNGERVWASRPLRHADEIRIGETRLIMRTQGATGERETATSVPRAVPDLTRRERDILVALCAPLMTRRAFTEPASIADIARDLVVTEAAVKKHLQRLYMKFEISDDVERRRVRLANEAVSRGVIALSDLDR